MAFALLGEEEEAYKELQNEVPNLIVEELEKIKVEIQKNRDEWIKGQDAEWHTYDRCLEILDKHIKENNQ